MSLSAHLVDDYEKTHRNQRSTEQNIVQSGAMEYNSMAHGYSSVSAQQGPLFSQFSQASLGPAYGGDASMSRADHSNMALTRPNAPITFQQMQALQQQREEAQALRTAQSIAALQAKLNQKLGPEYISQRPGPGGGPKLTYAEGWKIINLANEIFGFNGWSSSITSLTVDYIDYNQETQRYNVGVTAILRVFLRDGVSHEDVGYGLLENCKSKGMALDKCKKEAVTDALKRTLRNFGNVLGNCLYDKEYTKEILKMKMPAPPKMESKDLHRRKEFVQESMAGPSNTSANKTHPPMAPPPAPRQQPQQPAPRPSNAQSKPVPSTSSVPPRAPPSNNSTTAPSNTSAGPSKPNPPVVPTFTLERTGTDESLYTFGSDDDSMFADFSIEAADAAELDTDPRVQGVAFTDRSRVLPTSASTNFDPAPRVVAPSAAASSANLSAAQNGRSHRKMSAETKNKILEGLFDSEPSPTAPKPTNDTKSKVLEGLLNSEPQTSAPKPGNQKINKILEDFMDSSPAPNAGPSTVTATATQSLKPRASSGGGFAIPPGVSRPQRTSYPSLPPQTTQHLYGRKVGNEIGLGSKRTSEMSRLTELGAPSNGSMDTTRSILGDLEVARDGSVKRPRLS